MGSTRKKKTHERTEIQSTHNSILRKNRDNLKQR